MLCLNGECSDGNAVTSTTASCYYCYLGLNGSCKGGKELKVSLFSVLLGRLGWKGGRRSVKSGSTSSSSILCGKRGLDPDVRRGARCGKNPPFSISIALPAITGDFLELFTAVILSGAALLLWSLPPKFGASSRTSSSSF